VFNISWNGTSLLAVTNPVASGWANYQFLVTATGPSTILQFGYADIGANYLGLDDVSLVATQPPVVYLQGQWLNQQLVLSWTNTGFGLQSAPAITGPFTNLPAATSPYTNPIAGPQQFFRLSQ
jgi:hypothetical protein